MKEKTVKASDFPTLQRVLAGYLHEDFVQEYGTPTAALRAFRSDADASERRRFAKESKQFLERTNGLDLNEIRTLLARFGCRWNAPSRKAISALFLEAATARPESHER